ncbi:hypothetical protein CYMTET_31490 [Cymbomonas tetramitiformis]|uniref:Uncharacterized protein n=1 Tax=Cymbomonas tetramitiformis TaxID=36881 RepID=A0AAE0FHE2_9CHLO|nr:hypothetical protein CYMTET_31490 [Cymbomonas tetramitiformis]
MVTAETPDAETNSDSALTPEILAALDKGCPAEILQLVKNAIENKQLGRNVNWWCLFREHSREVSEIGELKQAHIYCTLCSFEVCDSDFRAKRKRNGVYVVKQQLSTKGKGKSFNIGALSVHSTEHKEAVTMVQTYLAMETRFQVEFP